MTIDEVLTYYGHNQSNVARALNLPRQSVHKWWKYDYIPFDKQCVLEVITKGDLMADSHEEIKRVFFK